MHKLSLHQIISLVTIVIFVAGCSSQMPDRPVEKTYSSSTLKEFEAIERNETVSTQSENATPKQNTLALKIPSHTKPKEPIKEKLTKNPTVIINDVSQLSAKNQERLQEINQNLAFFCMKHRNSKTFKDEEHCLAFTKKVQAFCEKKHRLINTVMLNCIKAKLKKRQ
jgi:hypothetical protein